MMANVANDKEVDLLSPQLWQVMLDMDQHNPDSLAESLSTLIRSLGHRGYQEDVAEVFLRILAASNMNLQNLFLHMSDQWLWTVGTNLVQSERLRQKGVCNQLHIQMSIDSTLDVQVLVDSVCKYFAESRTTIRLSGSDVPTSQEENIEVDVVSTLLMTPLFLTISYSVFRHPGANATVGGKLFPFILYPQFLNLREVLQVDQTLPGRPLYMSEDLADTFPKYELVCIHMHRGNGINGGHYFCFVKCGDSDNWNYCNDGVVIPITFEDILSWEHAVLFLQKHREQVATTIPYMFIYRKVCDEQLLQIFGTLLLMFCFFWFFYFFKI
jgi:hypothetical protein